MLNEPLYSVKYCETCSISPENPTGEKGHGATEQPPKGSAAEPLGQGWKARPFVSVPNGETVTLAEIKGEGIIKSFWITGEVDRGLIIRMYWDNSNIPSVECPLTDFMLYGFAPYHFFENGLVEPDIHVNSELICVNPNRGLNCYIPMPFKTKAKITIENRTTRPKAVFYQINFEKREVESEMGYFHARYNSSVPVPFKKVHTILDNVQGKGVYLGTALYVGLNRTPEWWGEGEFKFYLDGDKQFPTICYTGLEDYFGGAFNWDIDGSYKTYSTPYLGMYHVARPDGLYNIQQRFSMYRWHVKDPIRFENDLKVTVQCLGWQTGDNGKIQYLMPRQDDYISVSYWYQEKPTTYKHNLLSHDEMTKHF